MPVTNSPLRYPGGKTQLKNFVSDLLSINNIKDGTYVEPFAGGAGAALSLLFEDTVEKIIINDLDKSIYSFWTAILNNTDEFIEKIINTPITMENWFNAKTIQKHLDDYSILEIGFSAFFLNRTNISGIISGGPIGGLNQTGNYKLDCRFNKDNLIKKIMKIASYKERIHITNFDAINFINNTIMQLDTKKTFIFFDPPYYEQGKNLYKNFYAHEDHVALSNRIKTLDDFYWITTYDSSPEIKDMYELNNTREFVINYSVYRKRKAAELLFYSNKIILPKSKNITFLNNAL